MAKRSILVVVGIFLIVFGVGIEARKKGRLSYDFYESSCPNLTEIVRSVLEPFFENDCTAPSGLLRLMFHDCQVKGCDASILVDFPATEMKSIKNFKVRMRELITKVKQRVEAVCPMKVSCTDILILATREAIAFTKGPIIEIPLGRRDSFVPPKQEDADKHIPIPSIGVQGLFSVFDQKGTTHEESVAILGAHTLGTSHCKNVVDRLYGRGRRPVDPRVKRLFGMICNNSTNSNETNFLFNDPSPTIFDNAYYEIVKQGFGVLQIDADLALDKETSGIVEEFADDQEYFFKVFSSAFVKLASANVLTGNQGIIRKDCAVIN